MFLDDRLTILHLHFFVESSQWLIMVWVAVVSAQGVVPLLPGETHACDGGHLKVLTFLDKSVDEFVV